VYLVGRRTLYIFNEVSDLSISIYCVNCKEYYAYSLFGEDFESDALYWFLFTLTHIQQGIEPFIIWNSFREDAGLKIT